MFLAAPGAYPLQFGNQFPKCKDMVPRRCAVQVREKLQKYPAVALIGPRQCGKTTLARQFPGAYLDVESPGGKARLDAEWQGLAGGRRLVIIDEAQQVPELFPRLRSAVDEDRKRNGRFLLLGSISPELMRNVSQSLAGRLGLVRMSPFILPELKAARMDDLWLCGGYPDGGILEPRMFPDWQEDYLAVLASRDLPNWGLPAKPEQTMRLLAMLAAVHAQPLNASQLAASMSMDHKTILSYCDFLESAFLIRRLQPYFANVNKRLVKRPRVYWRDSGLLHSTMHVSTMDDLYRQPWLGQSWEGFVIEQTLATLESTGKRAQPFFFRTSDGHELDLVLDWGRERWAVEIKLTSDPSSGDIERLNAAADMIGATRRAQVCRVWQAIETDTLLVAKPSVWLRQLTQSLVPGGASELPGGDGGG